VQQAFLVKVFAGTAATSTALWSIAASSSAAFDGK